MFFRTMTLVFSTLCLMACLAFAEPAAPIPGVNVVTDWLMSPPAWIGMASMFLSDLIARRWPTNKAAGLIHMAAAGALQLSKLLEALAKFSDRLLPQTIALPKQPDEPPKA